LEHRVHLLGFRSDVPALLAAADVFVLPSLSEGLPLSLLEAMSAGRPVVASDTGDVRTVLEGGRLGVLVEPGNAEQLAAALDRLLSRPAEAARMGAAAAAAAAAYHVSQMAAAYAEVYGAALRDRRHSGVASRRPSHSATNRLPAGEQCPPGMNQAPGFPPSGAARNASVRSRYASPWARSASPSDASSVRRPWRAARTASASGNKTTRGRAPRARTESANCRNSAIWIRNAVAAGLNVPSRTSRSRPK